MSTRFNKVKKILDQSIESAGSIGAHGVFWRGKNRNERNGFRTIIKIIAGVHLTSAAVANDDCYRLVELSRLNSDQVVEFSAFSRYASNFCSTYARSESKSDTSQYGASYKLLALNMGNSNASSEEVYHHYCSSASSESNRKQSHRSHVESIAEGAYDAVQACLEASSYGITYSLNTAALENSQGKEFTLAVSHSVNSNVIGSATVEAVALGGAKCDWGGRAGIRVRTKIAPNSSATLKCKRTNPDKATSITVNPISYVGRSPLHIDWKSSLAARKKAFKKVLLANAGQWLQYTGYQMRYSSNPAVAETIIFADDRYTYLYPPNHDTVGAWEYGYKILECSSTVQCSIYTTAVRQFQMNRGEFLAGGGTDPIDMDENSLTNFLEQNYDSVDTYSCVANATLELRSSETLMRWSFTDPGAGPCTDRLLKH